MSEVEVLKHYGILGMKWGVRKDRKASKKESDKAKKESAWSRLSDGQRKAIKIIAVSGAVAVTAVGGYFVGKKLHSNWKIKNAKKLVDSLDINIPYDVVQNINTFGDRLNLDKPTWVTFKPEDNFAYEQLGTAEIVNRVVRGGNVPYKTALKVRAPIRAPGKSAGADLFREWQKANAIKPKYSDPYKDLKWWAVGNFTSQSKMNDSGTFISYLKDKGYNAIIDYDDITRVSLDNPDSPLLLFNGADTLVNVGSEIVEDFIKNPPPRWDWD